MNAKQRLMTSQLDSIKTAVETIDNAVSGSGVNVSQINGTTPAMNTGTRSAGTQRVTIATDDVVPASQSGTWTVQPGNTANTTAWLVKDADPCSSTAKTFLPISISTATTTEITPSLAGASTHYYVCSLNLVTAAANNVLVADDDSDGCGSPTSGIFGSDASPAAGEGWNFAANSGIVLGAGASSVGRTSGTNRVICILTSAATQLSGMLVVVAAP
jgi:hypothetical protein